MYLGLGKDISKKRANKGETGTGEAANRIVEGIDSDECSHSDDD